MRKRESERELVEQSMLSPGCNRLFIYLCHAVPPSIGYNWRLSLSRLWTPTAAAAAAGSTDDSPGSGRLRGDGGGGGTGQCFAYH